MSEPTRDFNNLRADSAGKSEAEGELPNAAKRNGPERTTPEEFFRGVEVGHPDGIQCRVTRGGANGDLNDHIWNTRMGKDFAQWFAEQRNGSEPAYYSIAAFRCGAVSRYKGRTRGNAVAMRTLCLDIEGSSKKYAKPDGPENGYPNGAAAISAVKGFVKATGLKPNFMVDTGSGGFHLYFVFPEFISPSQWLSRAQALVALAKKTGLKIDAPCTTNAAQIMRAPGSIHQDTGKEVIAYRVRAEPYTQEEFDRLTYEPRLSLPPDAQSEKSVGNDIFGGTEYSKFSYAHAAENCPAMALAAVNNGRGTPYPVWILAIRTAELSIEGRPYACEISRGHPDYDEANIAKKLDSLTGGPAGCAAWADAYGIGCPCDSCEHHGKIKNPAIQLGALVDATPPGSVALSEPETVMGWVAELNSRFALVRHGTKMVVVDFQTPSMTWLGVSYGIGFLELAGFRSMLNGRFAPLQKAGDKPRALADAWLAHPQRRQYEGLVYGPGEVLPANILNLWQGFAVEPVPGDVSPWLDVLAALVPNEAERRYVLKWIAWKIQNPGGVPDTILIFKGAKGTGKNSLFDPLISLFGRHAMLADDPELIAGRFTWHLMSLSFAVLDEAVFIGDPKQADRIKSRVTAKTMHYEQKGMDPVQGVNRCAYVMLTNHEHVWQATRDERRAVVIEVGSGLQKKTAFWIRYHAWVKGDGPEALLHHLQFVDLTGFNPRVIPKSEALRKQVERTVLRTPAAAWWHQCLSEGVVSLRCGSLIYLNETGQTEIAREALRQSYEQSAAGKYRNGSDWSAVARQLKEWSGPSGIRKVRRQAAQVGAHRPWVEVLPALSEMRAAFTQATQVQFVDDQEV